MHAVKLNRLTGWVVLALSLIALFTVLTGYMQPRHPAPADEGIGAHIFQIAIVLLVPTLLLFLFTADCSHPTRTVRPLAIPAVTLVAAFVALYYLEHVYFW